MLAEVIGIGSVDDRVEAPRGGQLPQPGPQLGLAEVAAVGGVAEVAGIVQLPRFQLEQRHVEAAGDVHRRTPLHLRIRGAAADDGKEPIGPERAAGGDGQQRRIHAAGIAQHHPAHPEQVSLQQIQFGHPEET
jgi:hypothetical protein